MTNKISKQTFNLFSFSMRLAAIFSGFALAVYAYLGAFSRHLADDFCSVAFIRGNFFTALWNNYLHISDRFSNFMLIALSESIWPRSVSVLPALMLVLWVVGIAWLLHEINRLAGTGWEKSVILSLSLSLVFFALLQAPSRFQTLYWRSSMATHFAPLVFMPYFAAFLSRSIFLALKSAPPRWLYPWVFLIAVILGGFSEPTVAIMIVLLGLACLAMWIWNKASSRGAILGLLGCSLFGALTALLIMAMAPGNSLRLGSPPPALPLLFSRSFIYAFEFMLDSVKSFPLPAFFTLITPLAMFYGLYGLPAPELTQSQMKRVVTVLIVAPVLSYILVTASFAPSVYGQAYPVARARFSGLLCLVTALMVEGAGLGLLSAQWRPRWMARLPLQLISAIILGIAALYPLRAARLTLADVPEYRERAELWDARNAYMLRHIALGETDIVVPQFPGVYRIKEWDVNARHWVNQCAAAYYGVNSVRVVPVPDDYIRKFLNE